MADLPYPDYEKKQEVLDPVCGPGNGSHGVGLHSFDDPKRDLQTHAHGNSLHPLDQFSDNSDTGGFDLCRIKSPSGQR